MWKYLWSYSCKRVCFLHNNLIVVPESNALILKVVTSNTNHVLPFHPETKWRIKICFRTECTNAGKIKQTGNLAYHALLPASLGSFSYPNWHVELRMFWKAHLFCRLLCFYIVSSSLASSSTHTQVGVVRPDSLPGDAKYWTQRQQAQ